MEIKKTNPDELSPMALKKNKLFPGMKISKKIVKIKALKIKVSMYYIKFN